MALLDINTVQDFDSLLSRTNLVVAHFWAEWASECQPMNEVLEILAKDDELKGVTFVKVLAESLPELSVRLKISAVPTFLFFIAGKQVDRLDGANAAKLTQLVRQNAAKAQTVAAATTPVISEDVKPMTNHAGPAQDINTRLHQLINQRPVMIFMKGDRQNPQCGFSRQAIGLLNELGAEYGTFDILKDEQVRQGLKTYSNWPTYPQLYVNGELVGGLDIMKEMKESGDLQQMLGSAAGGKQNLEDRLKSLINHKPLMVFIKGNPQTPRCGFSRQLVEILNETKLPYGTFDILSDEEVRQGLKTFSNWPTYPQVYVKGDLVGGLDIIKELKENGELESTLKGE